MSGRRGRTHLPRSNVNFSACFPQCVYFSSAQAPLESCQLSTSCAQISSGLPHSVAWTISRTSEISNCASSRARVYSCFCLEVTLPRGAFTPFPPPSSMICRDTCNTSAVPHTISRATRRMLQECSPGGGRHNHTPALGVPGVLHVSAQKRFQKMKPDFTASPLMKLDFNGVFELLSVRAVHWYACHLPKVKLQKLKSGKHAFVLPVERRKEGSQGVWGSQALLVTPNYVQRLWDMCIIPPLGLD